MYRRNNIATLFFCIAIILITLCCSFIFVNKTNSVIDNEPIIILNSFNFSSNELHLPAKINTSANETIDIATQLPTDISINSTICIWTNQQNLSIFVNDANIYKYEMYSKGFFGKMDGGMWHFVSLDEDSGGKELTLRFSSRLPYFGGQINEVMLGSKSALILHILKSNALSFNLSFVIFLMGLFIIFCSSTMMNKMPHNKAVLYLGLFTVSCALWLISETKLLEIFIDNFYFVTMLACFSVLIMPIFFLKYLSESTHSKNSKIYFDTLFYIFLIFSIIIILLQVLNIVEMVTMLMFYDILIGFFGFSIVLIHIKKYFCNKTKKNLISAIADCILISAVTIELLLFCVFKNHIFIGCYLKIGIISYVMLLGILHSIDVINKTKQAEFLENELLKSKISLMVSQMRPHFLFNALNAISAFLMVDPPKADRALTAFSGYLRGNIRALDSGEIIPFSEELNHIKNYVEIEQLRFGDKLNMVYHIDYANFKIPPLTIQPIIENSIKHGISKKTEGGSVFLYVYKQNDKIIIEVKDTGVGFDVDKINEKEDSLGMKYVKTRLQYYCNAEINISSIIGEGSTVIIKIFLEDCK